MPQLQGRVIIASVLHAWISQAAWGSAAEHAEVAVGLPWDGCDGDMVAVAVGVPSSGGVARQL